MTGSLTRDDFESVPKTRARVARSYLRDIATSSAEKTEVREAAKYIANRNRSLALRSRVKPSSPAAIQAGRLFRRHLRALLPKSPQRTDFFPLIPILLKRMNCKAVQVLSSLFFTLHEKKWTDYSDSKLEVHRDETCALAKAAEITLRQ